MNETVRQLETDFVLFLDASMKVSEPRWLSQMMGYAQIDKVGAVGARLVERDGTILHAGVVLKARHGLPEYVLRGVRQEDSRHSFHSASARNCSAVAGHCLLTPRPLFAQMGGFQEKRFAIDYYDLDYCLRLWDGGFRTVCSAGVRLVHEETGSGSTENDDPEERARFRAKYRNREEHYYSPHCVPSPPLFLTSPRKLVLGPCRPIRTLVCTHALDLTGAPYYLLDLVVALQRSGVIDCVISSPKDGPLRKDFEDAGILVDLHEIPGDYTSSSPDYEVAVSRFSDYVNASNCEVVYASTLRSWYAIESSRRAGLPSIWSIRESEPWQDYYRYLPAEIEKLALECFAEPYRVIFTADSSRDVWAALDSRHSFMVILDGLDRQVFKRKNQGWSREKARESLNVKPDEIVVLLLGTVLSRKGQHDFPRALAKLPEQLHRRLRCFIVGDRPGTYSTALRRIVARLPEDLRDRISIVPETWKHHDIICG